MAEAQRKSAVPSGAQQIPEWLGNVGIVLEGNESLAEKAGRAMGLSVAELRSCLAGPGALQSTCRLWTQSGEGRLRAMAGSAAILGVRCSRQRSYGGSSRLDPRG